MRLRNIASGFVIYLLVAGHATGGTSSQSSSIRPISADRAYALFEDICGESLPSFDKAKKLMRQNGITDERGSGTTYSKTENVSFQIQIDSDRRNCSVVWGSNQNMREIKNAILGDLGHTTSSVGLVAKYNDSTVWVLAPKPAELNGLLYFNLKMVPIK
jgi:hypothetical protein